MMFPGEEEAIRTVCELGAKYGYGNLIERLKESWRAILPGGDRCPADSYPVDLTIEEAKALRASVMGGRFDTKTMDSAIARIDRAIEREEG